MDREKTRQEFGQQLQELGFKKGNSLDRRMDVYILYGKPILGRPNHRTEVSVDFYGWKITYNPKAYSHYTIARRWKENEKASVKDVFSEFFDMYGL